MTINVTSERVEELARKGCFVALHVRRPSLRTRISWEDLGITNVDETLMSAPSTKPPSERYAVFSRLEQRMRTKLALASAGNAGGLRFMRWDTFETFSAEIESIREDYMGAVDVFLAEYGADVDAAITQWETTAGGIYDRLASPDVSRSVFRENLLRKLRETWPTGESLRPKFAVSVDVLNFTLPTADTMRATPRMIREARERASATLTDFFTEAQNELRASVLQAVQRLHGVLTTSETVSDRSVLPLREVIARFRELSVVADRDFEACITDIERVLAGDAARLRADANAWGSARDTLARVVEQAESLIESAPRALRKIRLITPEQAHAA